MALSKDVSIIQRIEVVEGDLHSLRPQSAGLLTLEVRGPLRGFLNGSIWEPGTLVKEDRCALLWSIFLIARRIIRGWVLYT
jgi:hypothetical protein